MEGTVCKGLGGRAIEEAGVTCESDTLISRSAVASEGADSCVPKASITAGPCCGDGPYSAVAKY